MPFHFPLFLGATGPGDPPHSAATLLGVSQVMMELHSCCFEPLVEAFREPPLLQTGHTELLEKLPSPLALAPVQASASALLLSVFCSLWELIK